MQAGKGVRNPAGAFFSRQGEEITDDPSAAFRGFGCFTDTGYSATIDAETVGGGHCGAAN